MTEIYLIRHAQAEGNTYRMMQGHWNGNVTELGRQQIETLAERFRNVHLDAVYSSDLYRAWITASALIRGRDMEIIKDPRFRELNMGSWEMGFFGNLHHEEKEMMLKFLENPVEWKVEGSETYEEVRARTFSALKELAEKHEGETIAVASHGVAILCLLSALCKIELEDKEHLPICGNTSVSKFIYENGEFTAEYIDDCAHTESLSLPPWKKNNALRDEALDFDTDGEYYIARYEEAWKAAHGDLTYFKPETYLAAARKHCAEYPGSVLKIYDGETPAGIIDMDTKRGEELGYGWISLLCLEEDYRDQGYGIQALARAIRTYKILGRKSLRLTVSEKNQRAVEFYQKKGFAILAAEPGFDGANYLMEKDIREAPNVQL